MLLTKLTIKLFIPRNRNEGDGAWLIPGHDYTVIEGSEKHQHQQNSKQAHQPKNLVVEAGTGADEDTNNRILSDELFAKYFFLNNKF